jgi:hypothetical protein
MIKLTRSIGLTVALGAVFMVAGCETQYGFYTPPITVHVAPLHPSFGNAIAQNKAVMIINPEPNTTPMPPYDGTRDLLAIERYESDSVETPQAEQTN